MKDDMTSAEIGVWTSAVLWTLIMELSPPVEIDWGTTCAMGPWRGRVASWRWQRERRRQYRRLAALEAA